MSTNIDEYKNIVNKGKEITLPSGAIFEIKKITVRGSLMNGILEIKNSSAVILNSENKTTDVNYTPDQYKKFQDYSDNLIVKAVSSPKISLIENEKDSLFIGDIIDEDYNFIVNEINKFSLGGNKPLDSFREK